MQESAQQRHQEDQKLARAALQNSAAWSELVERYSGAISQLCCGVCPEEDRGASFSEIWEALRTDDGALLRRYDGRASLHSFLQFAAVDVLSRRIQALLRSDPSRGWAALEMFFSREIRRQIYSLAGSPQQLAAMGMLAEDVYQDLALELGADGFRRLQAYDGRGSFAGFVRRVLRNLCLDWRRKQTGRRRLPAAIERLGELEQRAYQWMCWSGCSVEEVQSRLRGRAPEGEVQEAIRRVEEAVAAHKPLPRTVAAGSGLDMEQEPVANSPSPERILLEAEKDQQRETLLSLVHSVVAALPLEQRLYVRLRFFEEPPLSPRQIAVALGTKEKDVYRIRQDVAAALRDELARAGFDAESFNLFRG